MIQAIVDTGPLVAMIDRNERDHQWVSEQVVNLKPPMLTCESVLSEAFFLLSHSYEGPGNLRRLLRDGIVIPSFSFADEDEQVLRYLTKYIDQPMSLADACLVRMSELFPDHRVFTLDSHFRTYRRFGRRVVPLITP